MIDVGRNDGVMVDCLGQILPFWDPQLEMVVMSHQDDDHAGGLREIMETYKVKRLVTAEKAKPVIKEVAVDAIEVEVGLAVQRWRWGDVTLEFIWAQLLTELLDDMAKSTNDPGLVLRLQFEGAELLWLAGDVGESVEQILLNKGWVKATTTLKVAHHESSSA